MQTATAALPALHEACVPQRASVGFDWLEVPFGWGLYRTLQLLLGRRLVKCCST